MHHPWLSRSASTALTSFNKLNHQINVGLSELINSEYADETRGDALGLLKV